MTSTLTGRPFEERPGMAGYDNVVEPFLAAARQHPHKPALIVRDEIQDFATTNSNINRICELLRSRGVRAGDKVAYLLPNSAVMIEIYYAVQKLGAVAVPVNFRSIARELEYFLTSSDSSVLFFAEQFADTVAAVQGRVNGLRLQFCVDGMTSFAADMRALVADLPGNEPEVFRDAQAVSRIQFTGGSTGVPKGVERTHRADLVNFEGTFGSNMLYADATKIVLIQCPMDHHGGHAWFASALSLGATLVICASFDPELILKQIERHRVSYIILLPPSTLVRLMSDPAIGRYDLSSVRLVQSAAGGTNPTTVSDVYRHFPNAVMNYGWGQTETGLGSSLVLTREMADCEQRRVRSCGKPMPLIELKVVDADDQEVPPGTLGECVARSEAIMKGYYGQPEATAAAFTSDGWLRTGDLMVQDADGYLYLKSRKRELIKSGGENVFLGEVENVIREHPAVLDALVYGKPDPVYIEAVAAVVELRPGSTLTLHELHDFVREHLASYKKPRSLVVLPTLDRDHSGKIRRDEVIRRATEAAAARTSRAAVPDLTTVFSQVHHGPDVYRIELPLDPERGPLSNAHLARGTDRWLLVDPGPAHELARGTMVRALDHLGVTADELDVFVSHEHVDHAGQAGHWVQAGSQVVLSEAAQTHLADAPSSDHCLRVREHLAAAGFTTETISDFESLRRTAHAFGLAEMATTPVADGTVFRLGGHTVQLISTPGHTIGHACLWLPESGLLFSADHILYDLTPALFPEVPGEQLLTAYLASLDRLRELDVTIVLPGHGDPQPGHTLAARLDWLASHHTQRLHDLQTYIAAHPGCDAAQVTAREVHRPAHPEWARDSRGHLWSVASTTLARLDHLVASGVISSITGSDGRTRYRAE